MGTIIPIIAPFWADLAFEKNDGGLYARVTRHDDVGVIIDDYADFVYNVNPSFTNFNAKLAIIITWFIPVFLSDRAVDIVSGFYFNWY